MEALIQQVTNNIHERCKWSNKKSLPNKGMLRVIVGFNMYADMTELLRTRGLRPKLLEKAPPGTSEYVAIHEAYSGLCEGQNDDTKKDAKVYLKAATAALGEKLIRCDLTGVVGQNGTLYSPKKMSNPEGNYSRPLCLFIMAYTAHVLAIISTENPWFIREELVERKNPSSNKRAQFAFESTGLLQHFNQLCIYSKQHCPTMSSLANGLLAPICNQRTSMYAEAMEYGRNHFLNFYSRSVTNRLNKEDANEEDADAVNTPVDRPNPNNPANVTNPSNPTNQQFSDADSESEDLSGDINTHCSSDQASDDSSGMH